jgi:hypothetical protein
MDDVIAERYRVDMVLDAILFALENAGWRHSG